MCLTVTQTASQHDLVVTGSKDHYVKVLETPWPQGLGGPSSGFSRGLPWEPLGKGDAWGFL